MWNPLAIKRSARAEHRVYVLLFVGLCGLVAVGCGDDDPIEAIDEYTDCMDICNRYADCIDEDYDVGACEDRCTDKDYNNDDNRVDACETCLDDMSCTESVFACTDDCVGIVP